MDSGGDMKNETCPIHDCEYIPCIVNVTGFINSLDYPRTKSFPISWHMNCPYCERDYYESVYAEWGTYFINQFVKMRYIAQDLILTMNNI